MWNFLLTRIFNPVPQQAGNLALTCLGLDSGVKAVVEEGMLIAQHPPQRVQRALLTHGASPPSGSLRQNDATVADVRYGLSERRSSGSQRSVTRSFDGVGFDVVAS